MSPRGYLLASLIILGGCGNQPRPEDVELYAMALERARAGLELPSRVAIHPLLALWGADDDVYGTLTRFNAFDTTSIPLFLEHDTTYVACTPAVSGLCQQQGNEATIILSEIRDLGPETAAIRLMVSVGGSERAFQRHYFVRISSGLGGWSIVAFREIPKTAPVTG